MAISSPPRRGGPVAPQRQRGLITTLVLALVAVLVLAAVVVALLARGGLPGSGVQGSGRGGHAVASPAPVQPP